MGGAKGHHGSTKMGGANPYGNSIHVGGAEGHHDNTKMGGANPYGNSTPVGGAEGYHGNNEDLMKGEPCLVAPGLLWGAAATAPVAMATMGPSRCRGAARR